MSEKNINVSLDQFNDFMKNYYPDWHKSKTLGDTYYE